MQRRSKMADSPNSRSKLTASYTGANEVEAGRLKQNKSPARRSPLPKDVQLQKPKSGGFLSLGFDWQTKTALSSKFDSPDKRNSWTLQGPHFVTHALRALILAILMGTLVLSLYLTVKDSDRYELDEIIKDPKQKNNNMEAIRWILLVISPLLFVSVTRFICGLVSSVLIRSEKFSSKVKIPGSPVSRLRTFIDYLLFLDFWLSFLVASCVFVALAYVMFKFDKDSISESSFAFLSHCKEWVVQRVSVCFLTVSLTLFLEKVIIKSIALEFHRKHFLERIENNNFAVAALEGLHEKCQEILHNDQVKENTTTYLNYTSCRRLSGAHKDEIVDALDYDVKNSKQMAKDIFNALVGLPNAANENDNKTFVTLNEFLGSFASREEAQKLFELLDADGNGDLTFSELSYSIKGIYKDRRSLTLSVIDHSYIVDKLDNMLITIATLLVIIAFLVILDVGLAALFTTISTIFLSASFVFGETLKQIFQSLVFVFITHPYDVGDKIVIDGKTYVVKEIDFLSSTFLYGGQVTYVENSVLLDKFIVNIRRSSIQCDTTELNLNYSTTNEQIDQLVKTMQELISQCPRDFNVESIRYSNVRILSKNSLQLSINWEYKSSMQDGLLKDKKHNIFIANLRNALQQLNIELSEPLYDYD